MSCWMPNCCKAVIVKMDLDARTLSNGSLPNNGDIVVIGRHRVVLAYFVSGISEIQILIQLEPN